MAIFAETAPKYWAAGLPVIPLMIGEKRPAINAWQTFADTFPSEEERETWLEHYAENNIGLPLGPSAGLVAIDIDVLEPEIQAVIERFLPASPWVRIGKKGSVRLFRYNGHRTARIRKATGEMIVEILSKGSQIAIPPSIHPDTGRPYSANCELVDVLSIIPDLPRNIEDQLRGALEKAGVKLSSRGQATVTKWVPAGARDNAMVSHAGLLSRGILLGERTLMEALGEIAEWCVSYTERVAGDEMDPAKAQAKVIEFLVRDVKNGKRPLPPGWDRDLSEDDRERLGLDFEEEHEAWDFERIKTFLHQKYELHSVGSSERLAAMTYALERMAQNRDLNSLEEESLIRYMFDASGKQVTVAALKQRLKELRQNGIEGTDHTSIAEAVLKDLEAYGAVKFAGGQFWQWKGSCWEKMSEAFIERHVATEYGHLPSAKRYTDHRGVVRTLANLVGAEASKTQVVELAEVDIKGINFANGFLTEDLELLPHDPAYGMTYVLPYRYMPELTGHCPMFHQLLHDVWGADADFEDKIQALREAMAATLFQVAPRYQRAICLLGIAHSGKTTIMEIMSGMMPAEAKCAVPPTVWGEKFEPVSMVGKLLNMCGELSESKFIDGDKFKAIVEGTETSFQFKGKDAFMASPRCAHWFASNHMPRTRDTSGGFTRRWMILEFLRAIPKEKKIDRYHEYILSEEIEAIAAWAVEGIKSLKKNHEYTIPSSTMVVLDEMANVNNSVRTFLKSCGRIKREQGVKTREYDLYMEYRSFCAGTLGVQASQMKTFSSRMKELTTEFGFSRDVMHEGDLDVVEYTGLKINKKAKS